MRQMEKERLSETGTNPEERTESFVKTNNALVFSRSSVSLLCVPQKTRAFCAALDILLPGKRGSLPNVAFDIAAQNGNRGDEPPARSRRYRLLSKEPSV